MSNVSLAGGVSVNLTGTGGALAGRTDAATITAAVQTAIGKIEATNTGASANPVRITAVQQVAPPTLTPSSNGTVTLDTATLGLTSAPSANTLLVVALPADLPANTTVLIPANITNPVVVIGGTGDVNVIAQGTGGQNSIIYGNVGNNILIGDAGDTLSGGDGNDTVGTMHGNASIDGGTGNDLLFAAEGDDIIVGGDGDDSIVGSVLGDTAGNDSMSGGLGNDMIISRGSGNDTMTGDAGNDSLVGGNGRDSLDGGDGNDQLFGGAGADTLIGGNGNDNLQGGSGNDSINGGAGNDTLWGGSGIDTLVGGAGADLFYVSGAGAGSAVTIQDFSGTEGDQVDLVGVRSLVVGAPSAATGTTASVALSGSNTVITMPDGSTITLVGITTLPANSIIFG